ncbi:hypothetical protein [Chromobacterium sphagni]|uniref:Transmembrane protein n=1 Tax=Chromobacterium sphagni TaxID=1903179 RepID=A0A1S1WTL9_9NEIS|nr:hypothetical protein [Chromobacterium sphagni]OHX10538.1 hypothetical protein BI347_21200 [Chromobacterium sphagni]OHX19746.1 hypothetical protein BI344_08805 [Chromobacterium sphagni]
MNKPNEQSGYIDNTIALENSPAISTPSAVSWGAIVAGAVATAALSLILLLLGAGLELSTVSPWAYSGVTATTFGVSAIIWITISQLLASGMGGYLAGRLRTKWVSGHTNEVYFRDTAHGFLAWALAALITATLLTSVIGSIINNGVGVAATAVGASTIPTLQMAGPSGAGQGSTVYLLDSLFRRGAKPVSRQLDSASNPETARPIAEVGGIFMNSLVRGDALPAADVRYVGQLVAQRTDLSQQDAEIRVKNTYARMQTALSNAETMAKEAAEKARKASAYVALWLFISLLIGAFFASLAATYGGRHRDR